MRRRRLRGLVLVAGLALVPLLRGRPVAAAGDLVVQIEEVRADLDTGELRLRGSGFIRKSTDPLSLTLSGEPLTVIERSGTEVVALLPAGIEPGSHRLIVVRGGLIPGADVFAVAVGAVGRDGLPGEEGPQGPMGETGPQGVPGEKGEPGAKGDAGAPGAKGDQGDRGPQGPQGISGSLEGLACVAGEFPRWSGSAWECSREGASLTPEPTIGTTRCGEVGECAVTVPVVKIGEHDEEPWTSFAGGAVRTLLGSDDRHPAVGASVDEFVLRRDWPDAARWRVVWNESEPFQSAALSPLLVSVVTSSERSSQPWTTARPGAAQPVLLTLGPLPSHTHLLYEWWQAFAQRQAEAEDVTMSALDRDGNALVAYELRDCAPVAWNPAGPTLLARCDFGDYETNRGTDPLGEMLNAAVSGSGAMSTVQVDEVVGQSVRQRLVYRDVFVTRYVFLISGFVVGTGNSGPTEVVWMRANRLEIP